MTLTYSTQKNGLALQARTDPPVMCGRASQIGDSEGPTFRGEARVARLVALGLVVVGLLTPDVQAQADEQTTATTQEAAEVRIQGTLADARTDHPAIDAANEVFRLRLSSKSKLLSTARTVEAVVLTPLPGEKHHLIVRYRVDWVEWSESLELSEGVLDLSADARELAKHIDLAPIDTLVLSKEEAERKLKQCNAALSPVVRALLPPFFNRSTNVEWDDQARALILESMAPLELVTNTCVRADLNLSDGSVICRSVACTAR